MKTTRNVSIQCKGVFTPDENWKNTTKYGINRLYYIEEGIGWYTENDVRVPFEPGKLYFIPFFAGVHTYTDLEHKLKHSYVTFTLSPPIISKKVICIDPEKNDKISSAVSTLRTHCQDEMPYFRLKGPLSPKESNEMALLESLALYLTESMIDECDAEILNDETIITALDIMHSSFHQKITVNEIAQKCFISKDGFIKKFSRIVGETPYAYLKKIRLSRAKEMFKEGASVEATAIACGYADASSLLHAIANDEKDKNIFQYPRRKTNKQKKEST